tara:strand:+ start:428 stop:805 length:378 start_codon:yes stop_codon:yes gene_type:complete
MNIKNKPLKVVLDQHNHDDFPDELLMNILDKFGYRTDLFAGISRTKVSSDCPPRVADMIIHTIRQLWWRMSEEEMCECKEEQDEKFWVRRSNSNGDFIPSEDTQEYKDYWDKAISKSQLLELLNK